MFFTNLKINTRNFLVIALVVIYTPNATANRLLDYIRKTDLNDYALGLAFSNSQSPYAGSENSKIAYPYLTSFRDSAFTNNWLVVGEGDIGFRWVSENNWTLGTVARVQTLGLGKNDQLAGIKERQWSVELAPTIGYRGWPVHINFKTFFEILDRHEGTTSQLEFSYPTEWQWGYLIPAIGLIHQSDDYTNYYYGVTDNEVSPTRTLYEAKQALNFQVKLDAGFALTEHWLLSARLTLQKLDSEITSSPIVDRDSLWSTNIRLAYNAKIFQPRQDHSRNKLLAKFQFKVSVLNDHIDTRMKRDSTTFNPVDEINLEKLLDLSDKEQVTQLDFRMRLSRYHRIEISYATIDRSAETILTEDFDFGDETFNAGTLLQTRVDTKMMRISYGYSLLLDTQKELGISAGLHHTKIDTSLFAPATNQREESNPSPLLPTIGVFGSLFLSDRTTLSAQFQFFRMDFDRYDGSLNYANIELQHVLGKFGLGLGYSYYAMNLDANNEDLNGSLEFRHRGPTASITVHF